MIDFATLGIRVDSREVREAARDTDNLSRELNRSTSAVRSFGKALGLLGVTGALGSALQTTMRFSQAMAEVSAITRTTGKTLQDMTALAKQMGASTEFSASQAAGALKFLGMAGFTASESMKALPRVLDLATASGMGLAESADILSNVLSGFRIQASRSAIVADTLAAAASRSNTSVGQLGQAMSTVAPISAALNISVQETAAAIGVLSDAGIQGERAGTALRGILASIASPTKKATDALNELGLTFKDVNPEANSLSQIFATLDKAGISTAQAMEIFGREAASGALAIAGASERVAELTNELNGAESASAQMAATMRDTLQGDVNSLKSAMEGLAITVGGKSESSARGAVQAATESIRALNENIDLLLDGATILAAFFAGKFLQSFAVVAAAKVYATQQAILYQAALARMAGVSATAAASQVALAGAVGAASRAFALIGGPVGAAALAAAAIYQYKDAVFEFLQGPLPDNDDGIRKRIADLKKLIEMEQKNVGPSGQQAVARYTEELRKLELVLGLNAELRNGMAEAQANLNEATDEGATVTSNFVDEQDDAAKATAEIRKEIDGYISDLQWEIATLKMSARDQQIVNAIRSAGAAATDEQRIAIAELVGQLYDEEEASRAASEAAAKLATESRRQADAMAKAYERGIERIRDGFGDFFQRLIVDGKASFSDLLDLFKRMIAEMIATAAANRIMVGIGLGSASAGASAGSTAGGLLSGASGLLTGGGLLGKAGGLLSSGASALGLQGLASNAYFGLTNTGYNLAGTLGLNVTDVGALGIGALATAGAGMAGSFVGGKLGSSITGKEANSNYGAMAGSLIGSFGGPLGAFIGGTIGGFADALFGSTGNKFASTSVDLATGEVFRSRGGGESLSNTQKITDALTEFANIIGGSDARIEVGIGRKTGFELRTGAEAGTAAQSQRFKTADELVSAAMINIIENAKNLAPEVANLAKSFKGTAEQTAAYTVAMQNLYLQSEANPIDQVVKTFAESQKTAYWIYQDQIRAIKEMNDAFDGSTASAQQLSSALSINQQVAFALAQQYQNIALAAGVTASQSAQGIRESAMSRPELMASLMFQREGLMDRLQQETDAQKLADTFNEYIRLNERIFGLIDNPSTEQAERYAQLQESAAELVERRTEDLITKLENEQRAQNLEVRDAMLNAAAQQQTAADTMLLAAQAMQQAIQNFNFSGVFGGFPSGEVNA